MKRQELGERLALEGNLVGDGHDADVEDLDQRLDDEPAGAGVALLGFQRDGERLVDFDFPGDGGANFDLEGKGLLRQDLADRRRPDFVRDVEGEIVDDGTLHNLSNALRPRSYAR